MLGPRLAAIGLVAVLFGVVGLAVLGKPRHAPTVSQFHPTAPPTEVAAAATPEPSPTGRVIVVWDETVTLAPGATPYWDGPVAVPAAPEIEVVRHRTYGEDGIFGLPGWPWRADDTQPVEPTKYVLKWLGKSWPGPGQKLTR